MTPSPHPLPGGQDVPRQVRDAMADARQLIERTERALGGAYIAIRAAAADGYPKGGDGGRSSDVSDPTLAAVLDRGHLGHDRLLSLALRIRMLAAEMEVDAGRWFRQAPQDAVLALCNGGRGLEGGVEWGQPWCGRSAVTRAGTCDACRKRQERWEANRKARGAA